MTRPPIPHSTRDALQKNGWNVGNLTADRNFDGGVRAIIDSSGAYKVMVGKEIRVSGQEPPHKTLEWLICCAAMEANECAWAQPEYKNRQR